LYPQFKKETPMIGYLIQMNAKPGREKDLEAALEGTLPAIEAEPGTITWLAIRVGPSSYAIVDAFPDEAARQAHYEAGRIRMQKHHDVFADAPTIVPTAIIAAKLPHLPDPQLDANKQTVLAFYAALIRKDFDALSKLVGERYIQHNPLIADGRAGLQAFVTLLENEFPHLDAEIKNVFAEGDFVIAHVHGTRVPGQRGSAIVDIFRLEGGKIVEHWDVQQPIPERAANANGMF
jgi:predicted SnoaL-like aldol condensation-catalyzing enzyme/quinol monooxygenase YgiN